MEKTPIEKAIAMYIRDIRECENRISKLQKINSQKKEEIGELEVALKQNVDFIKESQQKIFKATGSIEALTILKEELA